MNARLFDEIHTGAVFSDCGKYRYRLWRHWDLSLPLLGLGLMNPSKAGEVENDRTISGQCTRAQMLGFGGIEVWNAFAYIETDSTKLTRLVRDGVDIIGPQNDGWILNIALRCHTMYCGWGVPGHTLLERGPFVKALLIAHGVVPQCLGVNADGSPRHPLYIGYDVRPVPF